MKSEFEIRKLYEQWLTLKKELTDLNDPVSCIVANHAAMYISTFEWVLDIKKKGDMR